MAGMVKTCTELAGAAIESLSHSTESWKSFLTTAAQFYKYSFPDQLMIYAQRPNATACAPLDLWNKQFGRFVRRGVKGIALIDDSGNFPRIKYVFDVKDTFPMRENPRPVKLWAMGEEHTQTVLEMLSKDYDSDENSLPETLEYIARTLAEEYYRDNEADIQFGYEDDIEELFTDTLSKSVNFMLLSRCGLETDGIFGADDYEAVRSLSSDLIFALGTAASDLSEQVLRGIEATVKHYERINEVENTRNERNENYDRNPYLHGTGGLSPAEHHAEQTDTRTSGNRAVRVTPQKLSERTPPDNVQPPAVDSEIDTAPIGDSEDGELQAVADDEADNESEPARSGSEQPEITSRAADIDRGSLRIADEWQTSVEIILRDGSNRKNSHFHITAFFSRDLGIEANTEFLKREYLFTKNALPGGKGLEINNRKVSVWFDETGITFTAGNTLKLTWQQAASYIDTMFREGKYTTRDVLDSALRNEQIEMSECLWFFYRDDMHGFPDEWGLDKGGFPEDTAKIRKMLEDTRACEEIYSVLQNDINSEEYKSQERYWYNSKELLYDFKTMLQPAVIPVQESLEAVDFTRFITEAEIDNMLIHGSNTSESKFRILSYFLTNGNEADRTKWLKDEYGIGGGSWFGVDNGHCDYDGKGISFKRGNIMTPYAEVTITWSNAAKRIDNHIRNGRYLNDSERAAIPRYEKIILARRIKNFYDNLPEEYVSPFDKSLDFYYPHAEEFEAMDNLFNDENTLNTAVEQMKHLFENMPENDRYYDIRKEGYESLAAFKDGNYTLFPGLETVTEIPVQNVLPADFTEIAEPATTSQISLFEELPLLPSVDEQIQTITEDLIAEAEEIENKEVEKAGIETDITAELDEFLTAISDEVKERLTEQIGDNPRSRQAVQLIREIYADILPRFPLAKIIERIPAVIESGGFDLIEEVDEYEKIQTKFPDRIVIYAVGGFYEIRGKNAESIAKLLELTTLERGGETVCGFPSYNLEQHARRLIDGFFKITIANYKNGELTINHIPNLTPDPPTRINLDEIADLITERVMSDADFAAALGNAQNRAMLRLPVNIAVDKVIREHKDNEPEVFEAYFSNDDLNDRLFNYVLTETWNSKQQKVQAEQIEQIVEEIPAIVEEPQEVIAEPVIEKPIIPAVNFKITDDNLGEGGAKAKFKANLEAITLLKTIEAENRNATIPEQETLSRYVGWGGLPQAFDPENSDWTGEYAALKNALTDTEYDSAKSSTLNAHYTAPIVIKAIYEAVERLGFTTGNVLEPAVGVGNFLGLLPDSMRKSKIYGVELDSITARMAKLLYPEANITEAGFENYDIPDSFVDLAIGNVPFGGYGVTDKRYDKHGFFVHDYFFAKTLDKVRPGGIVAFITSKGTLDKKNADVRKYIAERAELLGAVRLPNNAFLKNAGTSVTSDIIILQKRDRPIDIMPDWVDLGLTDNGVPCNRYFLDNPEMILGEMAFDDAMYGNRTETTCKPIPGADLAEQLHTALSYIDGKYTALDLDDLDSASVGEAIPADPDLKNFSYGVIENILYYRENSMMYPADLPTATIERIKAMVHIRETVHELMRLQLYDGTDDEIKAKQAELNEIYDSFSAEYGLINSVTNSRAFNADSSYYLLSSLEILDDDGNFVRKSDMFSKRTILNKRQVDRVDTASEALAISIGEHAVVDMPLMEQLTGKDEATLFAELTGVIFKDFNDFRDGDFRYVTADEFLSGNVREKLEKYRIGLSLTPENHENYQAVKVSFNALETAQPKDLDASEIEFRLGSTWIPQEYVEQFMYEILQTAYYSRKDYRVYYHNVTGEWQVTGKNRALYSDIAATVTYGTKRANAYQIIDDTCNLRDVRVYDHIEDEEGKPKRVLNKRETTLAAQKQELIKQSFRDWLWKDPERRQTLVKKYNEEYNSIRPREYDGSHITFSGITPEIQLRSHQLNAIAHILYGGNTLLAHEVGAGKTFEMIAAAMESKRLGLCSKSLFAVPNHLTEQWAAEFLRLYPSANILVATKKEFETKSRKKFCAKISTGDYDAVILGHSQLEKIPLSRARQERHIREQISEIEAGIQELALAHGERHSIKSLEKTKKSLKAKLAKLLDSKKRDDVVTFEELGVDRLFVDEAHNYKNLFIYTKMRNVAGISTTEAQKSSDLFMKCRYIDEITGNRGTIFATATPISNSMTELFTMQRYLQFDLLASKNLTHFDAWASTFGETTTTIELAPEGNGYRARTRFAKFFYLPELLSMFKSVADIKTADELDLPVPKAIYETVIVEPSDIQKAMVDELSERAAAVHNKLVDSHEDNMLLITTDGRKIGLDQRLINPDLPDFDGSKVNACTENVYNIWSETANDNLTQMVFCDFSTPNKDKFNVYDDMRAKLIERGVPENEIAFIHDYDTEAQKKQLFAKVRQGKVRILFGSTFKMGVGTNVQDRLIALHDADAPWRPADLNQRAGRIVRQGNMNPEVKIFRYATSGTFDSYLWQTIEAKQRFISQIMTSKSPVRSCQDIDETALSYAEIKALCAGNPLIAEKMTLDNDVSKLKLLKAEHQSQHYRLEDDLLTHFPEKIANIKERIAGIEADIVSYNAEVEKLEALKTGDSTPFPSMTIGGTVYAEKEAAAKKLLELLVPTNVHIDSVIGEYMGFKMTLQTESFFGMSEKQFVLKLRGNMTYQTDLGKDAFGNITRINHTLSSLPDKLAGAKSVLEETLKQQAAAKEELQTPFSGEAELAAKEARLAELNAELNIDDRGSEGITMTVTNDEENEDFEEDEPQYAYGKRKPSILDNLKNYSSKNADLRGFGKGEQER